MDKNTFRYYFTCNNSYARQIQSPQRGTLVEGVLGFIKFV